jgi:hypothetical protein
MDHAVLRKRLSTFKSGKGYLCEVSDDVVMDVLRAYESWSGKTAELSRELGISSSQLGTMIQKAKRLVKMGIVPEPEFKEIKLSGAAAAGSSGCSPCVIELSWNEGRVIRFAAVELLVDFLKKAA